MKKLMLFAAVAAIAGGAFAEGYDFTATLKTTKGKVGRNATQTYNLGVDATGAFWYNDADYAALNVSNQTTKSLLGHTIPALNKTSTGYLVVADTNDIAKIIALADKYPNRSAGRYCETVKVLTPAQCYRIAGSQRIVEKLLIDGCCTEKRFTGSHAESVSTNAVIDVSGASGDAINFVQFFGAQTKNAANKVEMYAAATGFITTEQRTFDGFLAGQGTYNVANSRITNVSGNIVGALSPAVCPNCCYEPTPAVAFDCYSADPNSALFTAGFGTFRIKYNSRY